MVRSKCAGFSSQAPVNFLSLKKKKNFFKEFFRVSNSYKILVYVGFTSKRIHLLAHISIFFYFTFFLIENGNVDSHSGRCYLYNTKLNKNGWNPIQSCDMTATQNVNLGRVWQFPGGTKKSYHYIYSNPHRCKWPKLKEVNSG